MSTKLIKRAKLLMSFIVVDIVLAIYLRLNYYPLGGGLEWMMNIFVALLIIYFVQIWIILAYKFKWYYNIIVTSIILVIAVLIKSVLSKHVGYYYDYTISISLLLLILFVLSNFKEINSNV